MAIFTSRLLLRRVSVWQNNRTGLILKSYWHACIFFLVKKRWPPRRVVAWSKNSLIASRPIKFWPRYCQTPPAQKMRIFINNGFLPWIRTWLIFLLVVNPAQMRLKKRSWLKNLKASWKRNPRLNRIGLRLPEYNWNKQTKKKPCQTG